MDPLDQLAPTMQALHLIDYLSHTRMMNPGEDRNRIAHKQAGRQAVPFYKVHVRHAHAHIAN